MYVSGVCVHVRQAHRVYALGTGRAREMFRTAQCLWFKSGVSAPAPSEHDLVVQISIVEARLWGYPADKTCDEDLLSIAEILDDNDIGVLVIVLFGSFDHAIEDDREDPQHPEKDTDPTS